jgi:hypothetical protein
MNLGESRLFCCICFADKNDRKYTLFEGTLICEMCHKKYVKYPNYIMSKNKNDTDALIKKYTDNNNNKDLR